VGGDPWELGLILGEPTGLTGNIWLTPSTSVDWAAAWSFREKASVHLHADYLRYPMRIASDGETVGHLYYGLGLRFRVRETEHPAVEDAGLLGVRVPLGLRLHGGHEALAFFLEIAPVLNLVPETSFGANGALGVRYVFR